jgi:hypothetical protein
MKALSRRSVTTGLAAAVTAIPAVGLCQSASAAPGDDPLLKIIDRYKAELAAIDAVHDDLTDADIDAWVDHADAILAEAASLPVLSATSAVAVIDLVIEEEDIGQHSIYGEQFLALLKAAQGYIVRTAT